MENKGTNESKTLEANYQEHYVDIINSIYAMADENSNSRNIAAMKEDFGKLGLFASAAYFLQIMHEIRNKDDSEQLYDSIKNMAAVSLLTISWYHNVPCDKIISSQIDLFLLKNKRYGNSFRECYAKDGKPYAFGHLQEKINRICSLLVLNEETNEEPLTDSLKDLLGYCILTLIELDDGTN